MVVALRERMRLFTHKGPLAFLAVALLAWWGTI
jgi:hypothetical protein